MRGFLLRISAVLGPFLIWHALCKMQFVNPLLFPLPLQVAAALVELWTNNLLNHIGASLLRVSMGYTIGVALAIPLGLLMGWYAAVCRLITPSFEVLRTVSPIAWIPLAIFWFGIGDAPGIFIVALAVFFPVVVATFHGIRHVNPLLLKTGTNFGLSAARLFSGILLPAIAPQIFIGMQVSFGIGWIVIVAAEMVGMQSGLGYLILDSRNLLRIDRMIATMLVIGIIGVILSSALNWIGKFFHYE